MASDSFFEVAVTELEEAGVYDVILPYLLVFTIVYAVLQNVNLFGAKRINVMLALVIAFFVIRVKSIVETINMFLPKVSLLLIVIVVFLLIFGIFGTDPTRYSGLPFIVMLIVAIGGILWSYGSTVGWKVPDWAFRTGDWQVWIFIAVIAIVVIIITGESGGQSGWKKFTDYLRDLPTQFGRQGGR